MTVATAPAMSRRLAPIAAKPNSGRIAATGGIFAARRAGTSTDSSVMPIPTIADDDDRARLELERRVGETGTGGVEQRDQCPWRRRDHRGCRARSR